MSWLNLSNNLSNLSGNFSNITGQISNFTREVLTESTDEAYDHDTESKLARMKIKELEIVVQKQKDEVERVNLLNEELRDRSVSAELQIQALSDEYRAVIEEKEKEIKELKSSQVDIKHGITFAHKDESFSRDVMEFEDPEFFQMTINKLKKELDNVKTECLQWKEAAKNQNNQAELQLLKDNHQQEIASLQSTYSKRMAQMNKKHQDELEDLVNENEKLLNDSKDYESLIESFGSAKAVTPDSHSSKEMEEKYKKLSIDYEIKKKQLESLQIQIVEEKRLKKTFEEDNMSLKEAIKTSNEKIIELEGEVEQLLTNQVEKEKSVSFDNEEKQKLEELDKRWRMKFDGVLQELNEVKDENVAISLELSQVEDKYNQIKTENESNMRRIVEVESKNEKLKLEKKDLQDNVNELEKLKGDIIRLGNCTSDLLEELEFQKGLSEEQVLEIESLRKICTIKGSPAEEMKKMQKSLKELGQRYVELYQHYQKVSLELRKSNDRLRAERQLRHTSASQLRQEISNAQQQFQRNVDSKIEAHRVVSEKIHSQLSNLDQQLDDRVRIVSELQMESDYVADDVAQAVSELGSKVDLSEKSQSADSQNETIESLIAEKSILERTIEGLERKVGSLEAQVAVQHEDNSTIDGTASPPRTLDSSPRDSDAEPERKIMKLSIEPGGSATGNQEMRAAAKMLRPFSIADSQADGYFFDEEQPQSGGETWPSKEHEIVSREQKLIGKLQEQLFIQEKELSEMSVIKNDLEFEKTTLEKVVLDLQKKLKSKIKMSEQENSFIDMSDQESETELSSLDWDNLVEAKEDRKALIEELEQVKGDFLLLQTGFDSLASFLAEQIAKIKSNFETELPSNSQNIVEKVDWLARSLVSAALNEIHKHQNDVQHLQRRVFECDDEIAQLNIQRNSLKSNSEDANGSLSSARESAMGILELIAEARNRRVGENDEIVDVGQSCEDVLKKLRLVVENFILESSGETDADKWRTRHDEALSEKSLLVHELSDVRDKLRIWKEKHRDVVDENTSLLETVDLLRQDLELMSQGQSALTAERELLQTELDKLQFQIDTNETDDSKEIGELKMQLDDLKIEKERTMKMVNDRDDFIVEQQEKHDSLVYQLMEEKDRDLQEIQGQLEHTMNLFKEKQEESSQLTLRLIALEEEGRLVIEVNEQLKTKVDLAEKKIEKLERELNDKAKNAFETEVMMKSLEREDEELREKELIEEDMLREQEILIQDLRNENEYLRDELNAKELLLKKYSQKKETERNGSEKDNPLEPVQTGDVQSNYESVDVDNLTRLSNENKKLLGRGQELEYENEKLLKDIASYKALIESLERRIFEIERNKVASRSPSIQESNSSSSICENAHPDNNEDSVNNDTRNARTATTVQVEEPIKLEDIARLEASEVNLEEQRLVEDFVKSQERIRELELEVEAYKKFEMALDQKEIEVERLRSEVARMMQVLRSKDELLLNLQMMEEDVNSDTPFSSRARVIQHIRDKDSEIEHMREKCRSLEDLAKHHSSQLELLKVERQNLLIFLKQREAEAIDLNERLENIQARSVAKEHASAVLHAEHQKLMELNKSQGVEIARLRERNQHLQNVLQERQNQSVSEKMVNERNQELEIQIAAFQQEQERLLTLIHEKDNCNVSLRKKVETLESRRIEVLENNADTGHPYKGNIASSDYSVDESEQKKSQQVYGDMSEVQRKGDSMNNMHLPQEEVRKYELEINKLTEKLNAYNSTYSKLKHGNDELKQKLDWSENEKQKLESQMEIEQHKYMRKIKDLENDKKEYEKKIEGVSRESELERSKISENFETRTRLFIQEWEEKIRLKDQEIKSLSEKIELLESVQDEIKSSDNIIASETERLGAENKKLRSLYEDKKNELSIIQGDIHKLKNISSASAAALNKMQNDNKYLIEEGNRKDNLIAELQMKKTVSEQTIQELETEVHRLKVSCKEIEAKATKDMERLRNHLIEIEEGYTNEAVAAQEREQNLEKRLHDLQEMYQIRSSELKETSNQSNFQIQNLQQQLFAVASQRDNAVTKMSQVQNRAHQTETALNNLQLVLERLQREKDSQYEMLEEESKKKLLKANKEIEDLKKKEEAFQARIQEATLAVQGVASLSKEVQAKEDLINSLKKQALSLQEDLASKTEMVRKLKDSTEGKLEKQLVKNLLLGYFHTPENKRLEVVRVLGNLIGFSQDEIQQIGSGGPPVQRTWVSSLIPFAGASKSAPRPPQRMDSKNVPSLSKSFTEMFVSFLEEESTVGSRGARATTTNQLTALLMEPPDSTSTPLPKASNSIQNAELASSSSIISNPLLVTPQDAKALHSKGFKTSLPLLAGNVNQVSTPLFPAPGQEIPRVHTSTANSALRTMLAR